MPRISSAQVGRLPFGDRRLLIHQPRHGHVRLGLPASRSPFEQLAKGDLGGPLGLAGFPEADLAAGEFYG